MNSKWKLWNRFVTNRHKVRHYLESKVANREDAADLLQDVGVIVLEHDSPPPDSERFVPWCMGIARNTVMHHWRRERRRDELFIGWDADDYESGFVWSFERAVLDRQHIAICLQGLDEPSRSALFLRYVVGKTSHEIGEELGHSPAAVRMRIMRARDTIRKGYKDK